MVPQGEEQLLLLLQGPLSGQRVKDQDMDQLQGWSQKVTGAGAESPGILSPVLDTTDTWPQLQGSCWLQRHNGWLSDSPGLHSEGLGIASGLLI